MEQSMRAKSGSRGMRALEAFFGGEVSAAAFVERCHDFLALMLDLGFMYGAAVLLMLGMGTGKGDNANAWFFLLGFVVALAARWVRGRYAGSVRVAITLGVPFVLITPIGLYWMMVGLSGQSFLSGQSMETASWLGLVIGGPVIFGTAMLSELHAFQKGKRASAARLVNIGGK